MRKAAIIFCICAMLTVVRPAPAGLRSDIDSIIGASSQKKVSFSVQVIKADTGKVVYEHHSHTPLAPASNMKLITTAAALDGLGGDFQYVTRVGFVGNALVVIGSGDPLFGDKDNDAKNGKEACWVLDDIVSAVKESGRNHIENVIVDSTIFDDTRVHPNWPPEQLNRWYEAEVCGVNFYGNCVEISARDTGSRLAELNVEPSTGYVKIINEVGTSRSGPDTMWFARPQGSNILTGRGVCSRETMPVRVTVDRPGAYLGFLIAERLSAAGIEVRGKLVERGLVKGEEFVELRRYATPLTDVLDRCNKDSLGLAAEALLKTLGAKDNGWQGGSWESGRAAVGSYLKGLGVDPDEFRIDDGSGLSSENKLSANAITRVLLHMYRSPDWANYRDSLAVGGIDGTAAKWFRNDDYRGKILGKTGYISGVKSFSGVCVTDNGEYLFSILANKATGTTRGAINDIAKAIIDNQ